MPCLVVVFGGLGGMGGYEKLKGGQRRGEKSYGSGRTFMKKTTVMRICVEYMGQNSGSWWKKL